ncbi:MAG: glycerol kinase [Rhizobiales bacterium 65-9]|nr:glycerol kinase GlpK [Hyphomicrobiales bacterium]OJY36603.1 MAG: glycerol kinase [Rhizobiales bacterium 65-9]
MTYVLAIDQGTTSSRAALFDRKLAVVASAQKEFPQHFPRSGWVEHDPEDIWSSTLKVCRAAIRKAGVSASEIAAIGVTNQRETTVVWDRTTGKAIHNAIVWQDRRVADACARLREAGHEALIQRTSGLLLDPYFSGLKAAWILDRIPGARRRAERGDLAFGTIDSFLIWRLTGGASHVTDVTNASRTMLFDIHKGAWDEEICRLINVPINMLPTVKECVADFGSSDIKWFGKVLPIRGVAGDQQAATVGQACFQPGMAKSTYGTGCFALLNTGAKPVASRNKLLTTIAYQIGGERAYALEGSIFVAGAAVQWLRDGLKIIRKAADSGNLAAAADPTQAVYLVPAFVGLGAPHWDPEARGAIFGLTRNSGPAEFARAALDSVCFQTLDLIEAMRADWGAEAAAETVLRVDGGMVASDWTMQRLADLLAAPVDKPAMLETTVLGAAYLAGLGAGLYPEPATFAKSWKRDRRFKPKLKPEPRAAAIAGWRDAVRRTLTN